MTDQPPNLVLDLLRAIRTEVGETNLKIGTLASSMVSMRKDIDGQGKRIDGLTEAINAMRTDIRMIAIAADDHTRRLDSIEAHLHLPLPTAE